MKRRVADRLSLRILKGGPFAPPCDPFTIHFRSANDPRAVRLREEYDLEAVAGAGSDFTRARRIKTWVRRRWNHGYDDVPHAVDALDYLAAARVGKSFACGKYAFTFVQCCLAIGVPARTVIIKHGDAGFPYDRPGNSAHVISEAYCRELGKWVVLDADLNGFYHRDGEPVGALEIHQAWHRQRGRGIEQTLDKPGFVVPTSCEGFTSRQLVELFEQFNRLQTKPYYNHLYTNTVIGVTASQARPLNSVNLCYAGILPYPPALDYTANLGIQGRGCLMTAREDQFNWPIQRTFLSAVMVGDRPSRKVELALDHNMPFFDHFELTMTGKPFRRIEGAVRRLTLPFGRTTIKVRGVDVFGRPGHEASITFEVTK